MALPEQMPRPPRRPETTAYSAELLAEWRAFCDVHRYQRRQAAHASRFAFMTLLTLEQREAAMAEAAMVLKRAGA